MIEPGDLTGVDDGLARRVISMARSIAPCLDTLEADPKVNAIAILIGVAGEAKPRGSRLIKSQRVGAAAVEYRDVSSWFSDDDRDALRALCSAASASDSGPIGQFPLASPVVSRMWPEQY